MTLALIMVMAPNYLFPSYFHDDQRTVAREIIKEANRLGEDPHFLVAIAWTESRLHHGKASRTGDHGIFQINWRFWGRRLGHKSVRMFRKALRSVPLATRYTVKVLSEMRRYKSCTGRFLPACYNGGPGWQKSKNKKVILTYAAKVNFLSRHLRQRYPEWKKK